MVSSMDLSLAELCLRWRPVVCSETGLRRGRSLVGAWEEETKLAEFGIEPAPAEKSDVTSDALSDVVRVAANTLK